MAKNSTTTQQQTNEAPKDEAPEVSFDFDSFDTEIAVPAHVPSAPRANALPFRGLFDKMEPVAKEGKTPSKFLPVSFWTKARKVPEDKATTSYQRGKLRDQFAKWQDEAATEGARAGFKLVIVNRTGKEEIEGIEEPGVSFWLTYEEPKPAEPEKAPANGNGSNKKAA